MFEKLKISLEMRLWFLGPIIMLWGGIYLSGFESVYWLVYIPAIFAVFTFITGLCPGMLLIRAAINNIKR